ncbi:peptide chain release factor 3 [Pseudokineococcus lusitanus]|uniref:Peptide chain release factor 3 n=1 Tax=Pseudokineococcus lusitanus TaxID=763993 RepID=A0A3N1HKB5_9ACTN|nr:peptide chain release factor 3 [Pseudokineococcus lusitanus]ROP42906.1 peptide chain release factor 3 [Pseudokineococcus lusitanus]
MSTHAPAVETDLSAVPADADDAPSRHAAVRRTFAVISHPDAGKSTLTEALALLTGAVHRAGHVKGKAGRAGVVSDWQEMEQQRGISISSAVLQLDHRAHVLNLVDTPGHADFSEDTYRVLAAVDCAVMLVDAARGMERQTRKLFDVCKHRGLPVITVVNKWDRPGREALDLMDEVAQVTGMTPTPLTWPVGVAGDFRGVLRVGAEGDGAYTAYTRTPGGATAAIQEHLSADEALEREGETWTAAVEEAGLLTLENGEHDEEAFLAGRTTPVLFSAAVLNFGVDHLLDTLLDVAPSPGPRPDAEGTPRPLDTGFSGQVFKIQAGLDKAHRDRVALVRVCSGRFERGTPLTIARSGRTLTTKHAQHLQGGARTSIDESWPGDVVGLVGANGVEVGDTLHGRGAVEYPAIPSFAPEHFVVARPVDLSRSKQFHKGIAELDAEGVVQVLRSDLRGEQAPVLAAVGPLQLEVASHRMASDFSCPIRTETLSYSVARRTTPEWVAPLNSQRGTEVLQRRDGDLLAVFADQWRMNGVARELAGVVLEPLVADATA